MVGKDRSFLTFFVTIWYRIFCKIFCKNFPIRGKIKFKKYFVKFFHNYFQNKPDAQDDDQDRSGFNFSEIKTGEKDPSHLELLSCQVYMKCSAVFIQVINLSEIILLYPEDLVVVVVLDFGSIIIKKKADYLKGNRLPQLNIMVKELCYITVVLFIVMQRYLDLSSVIISQITSASCTSYFNPYSVHTSVKLYTLIIFASLHFSMLS